MWHKMIVAVAMTLTLGGCMHSRQVTMPTPLPSQIKPKATIAVKTLANYTDTPDAGKRATNILAGVLSASGYRVTVLPHRANGRTQHRAFDYVLVGGVSEWRYKTGVDGEPAVSVTLRLIDPKRHVTVWSAVLSGNDWGNASLGTTAQSLFETILHGS